LKREIRLLYLLGSLSLSACGGSSSGANGNGTPPDAGGSAGSSEVVAGRSAGGGGAGGSAGFDAGGVAGLGSAGSAGSAAAAGKPTLGCAGWQLDLTAGNPSNATLVAGGVKLTRPVGTIRPSTGYFNSADVALEQTGLVGDFDITIGFRDFVPGDAAPFTGPRLSAGIWWHNDVTESIEQAHGMVGQTTGGAVLIHGQQFDINWLDPSPTAASLVGASGSFHVKRVGSVATVETTVNGQVVTAESASAEPFTEEPLTLFIGFDDYGFPLDEPSKVESGITITSVQVTGGGDQVKSDDFSCP
jgi:hypothetical protein